MESDNKELIEALCKAQSNFKPAIKDAANPFFKSKYADLNSVWEACKDALKENNLFVSQIINTREDKNYLKTRVYHKSGGFIESEILIISKNANDPQSLGSGITYMRRYSLAAILGIIVEDDDAEDAMARQKQPEPKKQTKSDENALHKVRMEYREMLMNDAFFNKEEISKYADRPDWTLEKLQAGIAHVKKIRKEREEKLLQ